MSSNSSGTTRSSRSRNKQSNTQPQQQSEEEQIPVRETRRKAMLKERVCLLFTLPAHMMIELRLLLLGFRGFN